jgi:hypothetical protein
MTNHSHLSPHYSTHLFAHYSTHPSMFPAVGFNNKLMRMKLIKDFEGNQLNSLFEVPKVYETKLLDNNPHSTSTELEIFIPTTQPYFTLSYYLSYCLSYLEVTFSNILNGLKYAFYIIYDIKPINIFQYFENYKSLQLNIPTEFKLIPKSDRVTYNYDLQYFLICIICFVAGIISDKLVRCLSNKSYHFYSNWVQNLLDSYENKAITLLENGQYYEAEKYINYSLILVLHHYSTQHDEFYAFKHLLAKCHIYQKHYKFAETILLNLSDIYHKKVSEYDANYEKYSDINGNGYCIDLAKIFDDLSEVSYVQDNSRIEESYQYLQKSLTLLEKYIQYLLLKKLENSIYDNNESLDEYKDIYRSHIIIHSKKQAKNIIKSHLQKVKQDSKSKVFNEEDILYENMTKSSKREILERWTEYELVLRKYWEGQREEKDIEQLSFLCDLEDYHNSSLDPNHHNSNSLFGKSLKLSSSYNHNSEYINHLIYLKDFIDHENILYVATIHYRMGKLLLENGQLEDAISVFFISYRIYLSTHGELHPQTIQARKSTIFAEFILKKYMESSRKTEDVNAENLHNLPETWKDSNDDGVRKDTNSTSVKALMKAFTYPITSIPKQQ